MARIGTLERITTAMLDDIEATIRRENATARNAVAILKKKPGWARSQVTAGDASKAFSGKFRATKSTKACVADLFECFDKIARGYLNVVDDAASAEAFCDIVPLLVRRMYVIVTGGYVPQMLLAETVEARSFKNDVGQMEGEWKTEAYRRALEAQEASPDRSTQEPEKWSERERYPFLASETPPLGLPVKG